MALPAVRMPVTMECAGNGRSGVLPRSHSMPWMYEAVATSEWTGTKLAPLIERACPKNEGRCFPVPTGSIQGRIHNSARCCKARTRGRDLQALGRFPPPLFQYLKPTCSHTSPSHYYHALQSWTPRHGTSTFTSPCLATTPPDMASYACLIYILASSC